MLSNTSSKWIFSSYCWLSSFFTLPPGKLCCLGFANSRRITGSAVGEENASLLELEGGIPWRCSALRLSTICVRNSQPQTKEIGKVFPLSALQILKIAIKHLDKISRWWQREREWSVTGDVESFEHYLWPGHCCHQAQFDLGWVFWKSFTAGSVTTAEPDNIVDRREKRKAKASLPQGIAVPGVVTSACKKIL